MIEKAECEVSEVLVWDFQDTFCIRNIHDKNTNMDILLVLW